MQTKLAAFRRFENLSQKEMAKLIDVDERTYINKEHGRTQFKSSEMFLIARKLNRTIEEIFLPPDFMKREVCEGDKTEVM